ncbi:MAG TPA: SDR family oxidoreductase [Candidatus Scatomorpha pullicola]|nr:SDR family oxidoreductase [Candidatus Scatomorpha pullicola]
MDFVKGKIVFITGGTRGIGFAAAKKFIENGAHVAIAGHCQETVDAALAKLKELYPDEDVLGMCPNLTSRQEMLDAVGKVVAKWGRIDVMINNAGVTHATVFSKIQEGEFEHMFEVNVEGVYNGAWAAYQYMKANNAGVIINTASVTGLFGSTSGVGYPASKAAVVGFTHELGRELIRRNIRVVAVAPGVVNTDMTTANMDPTIKEQYLKHLPMKRMLEPEEIANVYMFLASDLASGITATTVSVDGAYRP